MDITMISVLENSRTELKIKRRQANKLFAFCPECGRPILCINLDNNMFRCPACEYSGSAIDLWADLNDIQASSKKERQRLAGIDFNKVMGGEKPKWRKPPRTIQKVDKVKQYDRASDETIHRTLCTFFDMLTLHEDHENSLIKRGLTKEDIAINGYKSAPMTATGNMCHELLSRGCTLEGVPGFFKEKDEWQFVKYGSGIIIPSRDAFGAIHDAQVRLVKPKEGQPKYLTISSSGKEHGCGGSTIPHFSPGRLGRRDLVLTEGALKADIIRSIKGISTIGVLGVNSLSYLPPMLKALKGYGYNYIHIAYDMDMYENPNVWKAYKRLKGMIQSNGFSFDTLEWDPVDKGYDDYLAARM